MRISDWSSGVCSSDLLPSAGRARDRHQGKGRCMSVADIFRAEAAKRILITDGAFGTMIQTNRLDEAAYRGDFDLGFEPKGKNDLLVLTRPELTADNTRTAERSGGKRRGRKGKTWGSPEH